MRIKLDENLPVTAAEPLRAAGHDVDTVVDEGLAGASDAQVADAASREGRILFTMDRGMSDLRAPPPGTHPGIVVLRLREQDARSATSGIKRFADAFDLSEFEGCNVVVEHDRVRVQRPRERG